MGPVGYENMILMDMNTKEFIGKIVLGRNYLLSAVCPKPNADLYSAVALQPTGNADSVIVQRKCICKQLKSPANVLVEN